MAASKKTQDERRAEGLCPACGTPPETGAYCTLCRVKSATFGRIYRTQRKNVGRCVHCPSPADEGSVMCTPCRLRVTVATKALTKRRREQGLCSWCETKATVGRHCTRCWFRAASIRLVGTFELGDGLMALFHSQQGRCFYTGRVLEPGRNASIDHQMPRTRISGDAQHAMINLRWVDLQINRAKQDMSHEEFVAMCVLVARRFETSMTEMAGAKPAGA